ncbi:hypothetical protein OO014_18760 [Intrasporangium calvum]|uniref:DUF4190 domain-containing protein n=1 Tax=Intrasporangium calvum TaxID=53358 RepID=A0ABT5GMJ4_9MICO|nr:hypothetical protein [Intrasporangium calvum]MDC5699294.1 hypothetical protein [Intrasporangium calvum]
MSAADHPSRLGGARLAEEAPLARAALAASLVGVVFGFCFAPQLIGLALGGLSMAREPRGRRHAAVAIALALALAVAWAVVLGALLKWWAATRL